jgi:hypothetical protein
MKRPALNLLTLEDRSVPAAFGNAWIDTNLTLSFAPDATKVDGAASNLFAKLNARMSTTEWQNEIRTAFQAWVAPANLNIGLVADNGDALGSPGPLQGSPKYGDIRISARSLSSNVLAITNPFDLTSPWAGEIILNSDKIFDNDGSTGTYDLRTVLLQEAGHALGVGNSTDPTSVMFENYQGARTALATSDVSAITTLYGKRAADAFDASGSSLFSSSTSGNNTADKATTLKYIDSAASVANIDPTASATRFVAQGDIQSATDLDYYKIARPVDVSKSTVVVKTGGVSQASLKITVLDASDKLIASTSSLSKSTGQYVLNFTWPTTGDVKVLVQAASGTTFSVGSYLLGVGKSLNAIPETTFSTRVQSSNFGYDAKADNGSNDNLKDDQWLGMDMSDGTARWNYTGYASIDSATDVDVYSVTTTSIGSKAMLLSVWSETALINAPTIRVVDNTGKEYPVERLQRDGQGVVIQLTGLANFRTYFIMVQSAKPTGWTAREPYRFAVDFRKEAVALQSVAATSLSAEASQVQRTLQVTRSQGFLFNLSATSISDTVQTRALMTIVDTSGKVVFNMVALNGQTVNGAVLLAPGTYRVIITGQTVNGTALKGLNIDAHFLSLTDPIGPTLAKATTSVAPITEEPSINGYDWLTDPLEGLGFLGTNMILGDPTW